MVSKIDNITKIPDLQGMPEAEMIAALDAFVRNLSKSGSQTIPGGNILKYFELVQNACWSRQESENIPEDKRLLVIGEDPPDEAEIDTEAITFFVGAREPGQFGQGSTGANTIRERTHHVRSIQQHPEHPSEKLVTMGRSFDNYVVFNIYARTDYQALKRVLWFENVMDSFRWYFKVNRILSLQEKMDRMGRVMLGELSLAKYSITFFVKTEDIYQFGSQELKRIVLNTNIVKEG